MVPIGVLGAEYRSDPSPFILSTFLFFIVELVLLGSSTDTVRWNLQQRAINCQLSTINCQSSNVTLSTISSINYQLSNINYQLFLCRFKYILRCTLQIAKYIMYPPPYLVYMIVNTSKLVFRMYVAVWRIVGWQLDRVQGPSKLGIAK